MVVCRVFLFLNFDHLGVAEEFEADGASWEALVWGEDLHEEALEVRLGEGEGALVGSSSDNLL